MTLGNREKIDKPRQTSDKPKTKYKEKDQENKKGKKHAQTSKFISLKSKIDSLAEAIDNYEPTLICLVEPHLTKEEQIQIPGYRYFRNDGTTNSRSILITIKENLKTIVTEVNREEEIGQTLWVLINNQKTQVRV